MEFEPIHIRIYPQKDARRPPIQETRSRHPETWLVRWVHPAIPKLTVGYFPGNPYRAREAQDLHEAKIAFQLRLLTQSDEISVASCVAILVSLFDGRTDCLSFGTVTELYCGRSVVER
jgi:hypothetical protein